MELQSSQATLHLENELVWNSTNSLVHEFSCSTKESQVGHQPDVSNEIPPQVEPELNPTEPAGGQHPDVSHEIPLEPELNSSEQAIGHQPDASNEIPSTLDVPDHERQGLCGHMGHTQNMNEKVYQCPMSVTEVCKIGKYLTALDAGELRGKGLRIQIYYLPYK